MGLVRQGIWPRIRAILGPVAVFLVLVSPAVAGDRALFAPIGYSLEGRYFAFEEFGIQDGSGFAYSNIFMIDLFEDRWVVGTPYRVQAEDEMLPLARVRASAAAQAAGRLADLRIEVPAEIVAMNGDGGPGMDGHSLSFWIPGHAQDGMEGEQGLGLREYPAATSLPCEDWMDSEAQGFTLVLSNETASEGMAREVHRDRELPRSRGCPMSYRITAVLLPFEAADIQSGVALVSVYSFGFEGPDRRFVAIPLGQ